MANPLSPNDKQIGYIDYSAASVARRRFERTGQRTSPYLSRPEREEYEAVTTYQRPDGSRYTVTETVYRWNGAYSISRGVVAEATG